MKNVNIDIKSLFIGFLFATLFFITIGASSTPTIVKSDCNEDEIISRVLFCIDGGKVDLNSGRITTYCNN